MIFPRFIYFLCRKNLLLHYNYIYRKDMEDKPKTLQEHAMRFGTMMGIFWIIKFSFLPMGFKIPLLQLLFIFMTLFVPILGYIYIRKYRERYCGGELSFLRGWVFSLYMYFFASLLTAAAHYIYFQFIDNGYLAGTYMEQLESLKSTLTGDLEASVDQLIQNLDTIASMSALQLTMQLIFQNIFYGAILSLPTALLAMRRKKNS